MAKERETSVIVKDRILKVATELFVQYGIKGVSIRRIAAEAGINHALIIRYFGSKDKLVTAILKREITAVTSAHPVKPEQSPAITLAELRDILSNTLVANQDTMRLIVRSGLDGLSPESYVDASNERAANVVARWIASQQKDEKLPDAKYISILVIGAMFSMISIAPWLMTAVGLPKEDFEKQKGEILNALIWIIARAIGMPLDAE